LGFRLFTRRGHDWTARYPLIAEAAAKLRARTFTVDGARRWSMVPTGSPYLMRCGERRFREAFLYVLEVGRQDLRLHSFNERKRRLAKFLRGCPGGIAINPKSVSWRDATIG
jgi:ATP-dependent DNA ligase